MIILSVVNVLAQGPTTPLPQNQQKWNTNGNSVTTNDFIGTTNYTSLIFRTNNLKALEIDPNGNLFLKNLNGQGEGILKHDQNGKIDRIPFNTSFTQVLSSSGVWKEISTFTGLQVNNNDIIQTTTGNFGIGTSVPQAKLDVNGNVKVTGDVNMLGNLSVQGLKIDFSGGPIGPASPCISLLSFDPASNVVTPINVAGIEAAFDALPEGTPLPCPSIEIPFTWATYGNHVNTNNRWIGTIENFDFRIKTFSILRMIVKNDGKVGIGTSTPTEKLEVNGNAFVTGNIAIGDVSDPSHIPAGYRLAVKGKVICEEVKVKTYLSGWPDYVFAKNYKLSTLNELETYINANKHLPEIPSAIDVENNGINLAENNALLLKKIEELTLYLIEQNKKVTELITTVQAQQKQIQALENK